MTKSPVAGERGGAATSPRNFIRAGAWLRWCYENLSEHHYLLMLRAHRGSR